MCILILDKFKIDMFFKYKFGIEAKDYSHLAQLQNLEDVEVQTEWIIDTLYEVQDTVELFIYFLFYSIVLFKNMMKRFVPFQVCKILDFCNL